MAKNNDNKSQKNSEEYINSLKARGYNNPTPPPKKQESLIDAMKEGEALLEQDETTSEKVVPVIINHKNENPYRKARVQVLSELPEWRRKEIETMEANNNKNNQFYADFVRMVHELGDTLSDSVTLSN